MERIIIQVIYSNSTMEIEITTPPNTPNDDLDTPVVFDRPPLYRQLPTHDLHDIELIELKKEFDPILQSNGYTRYHILTPCEILLHYLKKLFGYY